MTELHCVKETGVQKTVRRRTSIYVVRRLFRLLPFIIVLKGCGLWHLQCVV